MCRKHFRVAVKILVASSTSCCLFLWTWAFFTRAFSFSSLTFSNCFFASLNFLISLWKKEIRITNEFQSMRKSLKLHQTDQAHDCCSWCLFLILYSSIHAWVKWKSTNYDRSFLSFFSKEKIKLKRNWTHLMLTGDKLCPPSLDNYNM